MVQNIKSEKISLTTKDKQVIKAKLFFSNTKKCVLLLHQFSKNKDSWDELIQALINKYSVFAIDLRGHGESTGNYNDFKDKDFEEMAFDVKAAINFLEEIGFKKENISIIGSSIGANLAQNYSAGNKIDKTILLSPGHNYKGIKLIIKETKALIITSKEDYYSYKTVKDLEKACLSSHTIYLENKGHGISMIDEHLISSMLLFLAESE